MNDSGREEEGAVTVVTWNMNHWQNNQAARQAAWDYLHGPLVDETGWGVALLQECAPPEGSDRCIWAPIRDHAWGTAVLVRTGAIRRIELEDDSHPGCVVACEVTREDGTTMAVVSLYGLQEYARHIDGEPYRLRYAVTAVHRMLSDLTPLIDQHGRHRTKRPLLLGGDLNISSQIDPPDRRRHIEVLDRCAGLGLEDAWTVSPDSEPAADCVCLDVDCRHVRTFTHRQSRKPWQLDYVFTNPALQVTSARAIIDDNTWTRSDHAPVAVTVAGFGGPR